MPRKPNLKILTTLPTAHWNQHSNYVLPLLIANNSSLKPILVLIIFLPKLLQGSSISSPNPCEWPHGAIRVSPIQSEKAICHILWYQYWHQHGYLHAQLYMHYCWCLQEWQPELQRDISNIYMHWLISGQFLKIPIFMDPTILKVCHCSSPPPNLGFGSPRDHLALVKMSKTHFGNVLDNWFTKGLI